MLEIYLFFTFNANQYIKIYPYTFSAGKGALCFGIHTKCCGELHECLKHFIPADLDVNALMHMH